MCTVWELLAKLMRVSEQYRLLVSVKYLTTSWRRKSPFRRWQDFWNQTNSKLQHTLRPEVPGLVAANYSQKVILDWRSLIKICLRSSLGRLVSKTLCEPVISPCQLISSILKMVSKKRCANNSKLTAFSECKKWSRENGISRQNTPWLSDAKKELKYICYCFNVIIFSQRRL